MMRAFLKVVLVGLVLPALFNSAFADHKTYGLTFMGSPWDLSTNEMWNVQCWFDSLLKNHKNDTIGYPVDTVINLWDNGFSYGHIIPFYLPRYRRAFVTDTASIPKWNYYTNWLANRMDSTDILFVMIGGHGEWTNNHCIIDAYACPEGIYDTTIARALNEIPCKLRVVYIWSSYAFGKGNTPDSSGFATVFCYSAPESIGNKTIFFSHAGPAPSCYSVVSDDKRTPTSPVIPGFEQPIYSGDCFRWIEGLFPFQMVFDAGIEPSYYSGDSIWPGFYFDSIDVAPRDGRLTLYEDSIWIHRWSSRLGWSSCPMVDLGRKAKRVCVWPFIGFIDSLDGLPIAVLPDTADFDSVTPIVRVKNLGFTGVNIPVRLRIAEEYNQVRVKFIGPNQEDTVCFPVWHPNQTGWVSVRCSTELTYDEKPVNDLLLDSIYILPVGIAGASPLPIAAKLPTVMTLAQFNSNRARLGRFEIYDATGRQIAPEKVNSGIYFLKNKGIKKIILN